MLIVLFVGPLKAPLVNAKDVQLRERRENFCLKIFCLKIKNKELVCLKIT